MSKKHRPPLTKKEFLDIYKRAMHTPTAREYAAWWCLFVPGSAVLILGVGLLVEAFPGLAGAALALLIGGGILFEIVHWTQPR